MRVRIPGLPAYRTLGGTLLAVGMLAGLSACELPSEPLSKNIGR